MKMSSKTKLLLSAITSASIAVMAAPTYAQDTFEPVDVLDTTVDAEEEDAVVTTGSRIRRNPELDTAFPTLVVDQELFEKNAFTNIADALGQIPAFGVGTTPDGGQGGNVGVNFADFLGLGSQRTLTLVNGRRFVSSNAIGNGAQVDFGVIPIGLVERIETVGVGGAPTYGSDAIAGTINVILKEDYEGFEASAQYGESERGDTDIERYSFLAGVNSDNGRGNVTFNAEYTLNAGLNQTARPDIFLNESRAELVGQSFTNEFGVFQDSFGTNIPTPSQFVGTTFDDMGEFERDAAGEVIFRDEDGNIVPSGTDGATATPLADGFLDSVNRIINPNGESVNIQLFTDGGVISPGTLFIPSFGLGSFGGVFREFDTNGNLVEIQPGVTPPSGAFRSIGGFGNDFFINTTQITSPVERINFGSTFKYDINDLVRFKGDFQFSQSNAVELANQGGFQTFAFGGTSGALEFGVDNPFLTDQAFGVLTNDIGLAPTDTFFLSRFNNDLLNGGEVEREATLFRIAGGFEGDFEIGDKTFYWDLTAVNGQTNIETQQLLLNNQRFLNAIDAVVDPATGDIVCAVTLAGLPDLAGNGVTETSTDVTACEPLNLFGDGVASAEALDFVTNRGINTDDINQSVFTANFGGELIDLPAGPLQFNVGYETRNDSALFATGAGVETGIGRGAATADSGGEITTEEYYGEVSVPIASPDLNIPLVESLEVGAQIREIDNSQAGDFTSWTIEGTYKPVEDLTLRGNVTRSLRAPSLLELFQPITTSFQFGDDPCDERFIGDGPNRAANCASIGITQPFNSFVVGATAQGLTGGNPNLTNEEANAWTLGAILEPRFVPGLVLQADYINIDIEDRIGAQTLENNLETCFDADPADFPNAACSTFTRDADGQVVDFQSGQLNADNSENQFLNLRGDYRFDVADLFGLFGSEADDAGDFSIGANIFHAIQRDLTVAGVEQDATIGNFFDPKWSGTGDFTYSNNGLRLFWRTLWQNRTLLDPSGDTLFFNTEDELITANSSNFVHNASISYDVSQLTDSYDKPIIVQMNVNNVFDDTPDGVNSTRRAFGDFFQSEIIGRSYSFRVRATF